MENRPDIFYYLKDHSLPPPPEIAQRLKDALALENTTAPEDAPGLERLRRHSTAPPPALKHAILQKTVQKSRPPHYTRLLQVAAAACILLLAGGICLYTITPKQTPPSPRVSTTLPPKTRPTPPPDSNAVIPDSATTPTTSEPTQPIIADKEPLSPSLNLDGEKYPLTGNNLLATFTSYDYPALKVLLDKPGSEKGLNIRLDQYTHINLSRTMTALLRDCYSTRPDGSPAQKAKKTRQLLQKWSDQDRKQFAAGLMASPLDVVDLGQFLFPPFFSLRRHAPAPLSSVISGKIDSVVSFTGPTTNRPVTVSYTLSLRSKKSGTGIAETYNGGMQTLFDAGHHARLRLASLMRIQSTLFNRGAKTVTILTESTRPRGITVLHGDQWNAYNNKYAGATTRLKDDTLGILGYVCKKALIHLHDGREIVAWYSPDLRPGAQAVLEPAFASLPGLVLRYEYTCRHTILQYNAVSINRGPIDPSVFAIPENH